MKRFSRCRNVFFQVCMVQVIFKLRVSVQVKKRIYEELVCQQHGVVGLGLSVRTQRTYLFCMTLSGEPILKFFTSLFFVNEMAVIIHIAGQSDFPCPDGWTVDITENRIRSRYGFLNGGIDRNCEAMASTDKITPGPHYEFVNFQSQQSKVSEHQKQEGPKLKDGVLELQQNLTLSPPSEKSMRAVLVLLWICQSFVLSRWMS